MIGRRFKREVDGRVAPDRNDEYLLYQTLIGAWPDRDTAGTAGPFVERVCRYMEKATKEAKRHTSWVNPNAAYDQALREFVIRPWAGSPFPAAFGPFQRLVALYGSVNSLGQVLLKIAAPGIPDFYQGSELWDLALVDPDNRRPVDFAFRRTLLDDIQARIGPERIGEDPHDLASLCAELLAAWPDGRIKLYVTHRALTLRRSRPALFQSGRYLPLSGTGAHAEHIVAFARLDGAEAVMVAVPRLAARLTGFDGRFPLGPSVWGDTRISLDPGLEGTYQDRFSSLRISTEWRDGMLKLPAERSRSSPSNAPSEGKRCGRGHTPVDFALQCRASIHWGHGTARINFAPSARDGGGPLPLRPDDPTRDPARACTSRRIRCGTSTRPRRPGLPTAIARPPSRRAGTGSIRPSSCSTRSESITGSFTWHPRSSATGWVIRRGPRPG